MAILPYPPDRCEALLSCERIHSPRGGGRCPTFRHPGVFVEEIPSGARPIEGVGTSTAAFVGFTTKGPKGKPRLLLNFDDYVSQYGGIRDLGTSQIGDRMGLAVSAFFQNGGTRAYVVRLAKDAERARSGTASVAADLSEFKTTLTTLEKIRDINMLLLPDHAWDADRQARSSRLRSPTLRRSAAGWC